ncbi:hypothetical protein BBJ28_00004126 [Nothophytophthora sp. Chile5]|nr:hypothetical protein BBJ28_00004126 [Nothophytophthora sp. Chile5]
MKSLVLAAASAVLAVSVASMAEAISPPRDRGPLFNASLVVRSLDEESYGVMLNDSNTVWLVDYYSSWCAHCRMFAPEWEKVGTLYADADLVQVGAVDCNQHKSVCNRERIRAYPAVKVHHVPFDAKESVQVESRGRKNAKVVVTWVETLLGEHGIDSGVNVEDLVGNTQQLRSDAVATEAESSTRDQSVELKFQRLRDAGRAAVLSLENSFYLGTTVLEGDRYDAALMWVDALAASFPLEGNRAALTTLSDAMRQQKRWDQADWSELLQKWRPIAKRMSFPTNLFEANGDEDDGWAFCSTYTCGLWTLFHSITVSDSSSAFSREPWKPSEIMAAIRLYVKHFFGCEECREHFMKANPEGVVEMLAASDAKGSHAVIMWIWKMHNAVNKVLKKGQWPSKRECPLCYIDIGGMVSLDASLLQEDEIVAFVSSVYKHESKEIYEQSGVTSVLGSNSLTAILLLLALVTVAFKTQRHRRKDVVARDHIA